MGSSNAPEPHLTPKQLQALLKFLSTAPPAASEWTIWQTERLLNQVDSAAGVPAVPDVEDDDFYNDMEGEDDVMHRRRVGTATLSADGAKLGKPRVSGGTKAFLIAVLVIGVAVGIWFAGKPADEPMDSAPVMGEQTSPAEAELRQTELEAAVAANPEDLDARLELGVLYFNEMRVPEAVEQWELVTDFDPDNVTAWYNLGFAYLSADPAQTDLAEEAWQKVLDLEPDSELAETVSMHLQGLQEPGESADQ